MKFINSNFFIHLLWSVPTIIALLYFASQRRQKILLEFLGKDQKDAMTKSVNHSARWRKIIYFTIAWCCLITALARPWWGSELADFNGASRDILVCLDTSKSMLAKDIVPSRLQHAKHWLKELVQKCSGDRFGLINFAGQAILECPLTSSPASFNDYLDGTDTSSIPLGGTNIGSALELALTAFEGAEGDNNAVILISDGDELQGDSKALLDKFKEKNIPVFSVGIGNPLDSGVIELEDGKILKDSAGKPVISKLNEKGLANIATSTNGLYVRTTVFDRNINPVYKRIMDITPEALNSGKQNRKIERFYYPATLAFIFLLCFMFVGDRKKTLTCFMVALILNQTWGEEPIPNQLIPLDQLNEKTSQPNQPTPEEQQKLLEQQRQQQLLAQKEAERKERTSKIMELEAELEKLSDDEPLEKDRYNFNIGALYQKNGDLEKAGEYYGKISGKTDNQILLRELNNLATIELEKATKILMQKPEDAIKALEEAQYNIQQVLKNSVKYPEIFQAAQKNLRVMLKLRKTARAVEAFMKVLKEKMEKVVKSSLKAYEEQEKIAKGETPKETVQQAQNSKLELKTAIKNLTEVIKILEQGKLPEEQKKQMDSANDDLKAAKNITAQEQVPMLTTERKIQLAQEAQKLIASALQKLGAQPPQQQQQQNQQQQKDGEKSENSKDQQQGGQKDGDKKDQQQKQDGQKGDQSGLSEEQMQQLNQGDKSDKEPTDEQKTGMIQKKDKVDEKQMEAILREIQGKERKLKDALKELRQRKMNQRQQNQKNW